MTDFDPADFASVDPEQFAQLVKSTPDATSSTRSWRASTAARSWTRSSAGSRALFRADRAGSTNAVIHWNITGRPDGGTDTYEVVIADGACTVSPSRRARPEARHHRRPASTSSRSSPAARNPMMMFMTGKLKAKGDLGLAANIANLFDIPKA